MNNIYTAALAAAHNGWFIFPLKPASKEPLGKWKEKATNRREDVQRIFTPATSYNYGVHAGASNLVIIDDDKQGEFSRWLADHGHTMPNTYTVKTPHGAHHYFTYQHSGDPIGNHTPFKDDGYQIDVRGDGGYVVGAGSVHPDGGMYEILTNVAPAPLPDYLKDYLKAEKPNGTHAVSREFGTQPGDVLAALSWADLLQPHGWTLSHQDGRNEYWTRPGKNAGTSASASITGACNSFHVFSSNAAPFRADESYTRFGVYSLLNHGGDMAAAARTLSNRSASEDFMPLPVQSEARSGNITRRVYSVPASSVTTVGQKFLKKDWYPLDVVTLVSGKPGEGKSTIVLGDVAAATRGNLVGDKPGALTVAISATEDSRSMQVMRLKAAGADLDRVHFLSLGVFNEDGEIVDGEGNIPALPQYAYEVKDELQRIGADMWVIDPLHNLIRGDITNAEDVRNALDPLTALARDVGISVVCIGHFTKGAGAARDKVAGSYAIQGVIRSLITVAQDPETPRAGVLTIGKSNYSTGVGTSWEYKLESVNIPDDNGNLVSVGRAVFGNVTDKTVEQIINRPIRSDERPDDVEEAFSFLMSHLEENGGSDTVKRVYRAAKEAGVPEGAIKRAVKQSEGAVTRQKGGYGKAWEYRLTDAETDFQD